MAMIKVLYKEPVSYFPKEILEELFSDSPEKSEKDKESSEKREPEKSKKSEDEKT